MPYSSLYAAQIVEDIFAGDSAAEEISFEEAFSDRELASAHSTPVISALESSVFTTSSTTKSSTDIADATELPVSEPSISECMIVEPIIDDSFQQSSQKRAHQAASEDSPEDHVSPQDFQMWGQVSFKFAEVLAQWRREELWRQVAPSWEAFVLQHVKLSQAFVNELCEIAERAEERSASRPTVGAVRELEPFIPCSVHRVARRIQQHLQTRPDYSKLTPSHQHCMDASDYVEFELGDFRVYVWFDYVMPLDGQPHHFTRPWISNIDFQLCGEGYGEGLYSWLNISHTDIQMRNNASASTLTAWTSWAEALQQELARSFVPSGMAVAIDSPLAASGYRVN